MGAASKLVDTLPRYVASGKVEQTCSRQLDALVRAHLPHVYRLLRQMGVLEQDADDATQQVFLILSRRLTDVAPGRERAFLSATAVRIASRWRRTHRRRREDDEAEPVSQRAGTDPSPESRLEHAQAQRLLLEVLSTLPDKLREVFVLFEIEGLTLREIAETLEQSQGTVASRLRLGRERFHRTIQEFGLADTSRRTP